MVAMRQREVTAHAFAEWARPLILAPTDCTFTAKETTFLQVGPRRSDLATTTTPGHETSTIEANILSRQRHHLCCICGNAHTIRRSLSASESPAASTVGLIADVADDFCTLWPICFGIEVVRDCGIGIGRHVLHDLTRFQHVGDGFLLVALDAHQVHGCAWSL